MIRAPQFLSACLAAAAIALSGSAQATAIDCTAPATRASQIICEAALFSMGYQRIYTDQQRLLAAGTISQSDIDAFRKKRDACDAAPCLDSLFSAWRQHLVEIGASRPSRARPQK